MKTKQNEEESGGVIRFERVVCWLWVAFGLGVNCFVVVVWLGEGNVWLVPGGGPRGAGTEILTF